MMRKYWNLLIVFILLCIPNIVFADASRTSHEHIFSVEKFTIDNENSVIDIAGYSFISHQDNYGILNGSTKGNLRTYIVAYVGDWDDSYVTCENNQNCYSTLMEATDRNFYFARCNIAGCHSGGGVFLDESKARESSGKFVFDSVCNNLGGTGKSSACLYTNVGFKGKVKLVDIFDKFSNINYEDINFNIVSSVDSSNYCLTQNNVVASCQDIKGADGVADGRALASSTLAVYSGVCKIGGTVCPVNGDGSVNIETDDYKFTISSWSEEILYDATESHGRKSDGNAFSTDQDNYPNDAAQYGHFVYGVDYNILKYRGNVLEFGILSKIYDTNGNEIGENEEFFYDSMVKLDSRLSTNTDASTGVKKIVSANNGDNGDDDYDGYDYWALANFVVFDGSLKIDKNWESKGIADIECGDVSSISQFNGSNKTSASANCGETDSLNQCVKYQEVSAYIYVPTSNSCTGITDSITQFGSANYYKINVKTDVLINQKATFSFGAIKYDGTSNFVYAGKGFGLGNTSYINNISWMNAKVNLDDGSPHYDKSYKFLTSSCEVDNDGNLNDYNTFYYVDINGNLISKNNWKDAAFNAIGAVIYNKINTSNVNNVGFVSCDSNNGCDVDVYSNLSSNEEIIGVWQQNSSNSSIIAYNYPGYSQMNYGESFDFEFNYSLPYSYIGLIGDEHAKVYYTINDNVTGTDFDNRLATGRKYYVNLRWSSDKLWPFNLKSDLNPSLLDSIDGWNWNLTGVCNINVKDGYYNESSVGGNKLNLLYKYRSISVSNPFPKASIVDGNAIGVAENWKKWYLNYADSSFGAKLNKVRLDNTYNKLDYSIKFAKNSSSVTDVKDIINYNSTTSYGSLYGMNKDGTSNFINVEFDTDFGIKINSNNYCKLGFFRSTCDLGIVQEEGIVLPG